MKSWILTILILVSLVFVIGASGCAPASVGEQQSNNIQTNTVEPVPSVKIASVSCNPVGRLATRGINGEYFGEYDIELLGSAAGPMYSSLSVDFENSCTFDITSSEWSNPENAAAYPHRQQGEPAAAEWDARDTKCMMADGDKVIITASVTSPNSEQPRSTETRTLTFPC